MSLTIDMNNDMIDMAEEKSSKINLESWEDMYEDDEQQQDQECNNEDLDESFEDTPLPSTPLYGQPEIIGEKSRSLNILKYVIKNNLANQIANNKKREKQVMDKEQNVYQTEQEKQDEIAYKKVVKPHLNWAKAVQQDIVESDIESDEEVVVERNDRPEIDDDDFPSLSSFNLQKKKVVPVVKPPVKELPNESDWKQVTKKEKREKVVVVSKEPESLTNTKMCSFILEGKKCLRGARCNYAHDIKDLNIRSCLYDDKCIFVVQNAGVFYNNDKQQKVCFHKHLGETVENYLERTGIQMPLSNELPEELEYALSKLQSNKFIEYNGNKYYGKLLSVPVTKKNKVKKENTEISKKLTFESPQIAEVPKVDEGWKQVQNKKSLPQVKKLEDPVKKGEEVRSKTQMCRSILDKVKCPHGKNCRFAHTVSELVVNLCGYGDKCKLVKKVGGGYTNSNTAKTCSYRHPGETRDNFYKRNKF